MQHNRKGKGPSNWVFPIGVVPKGHNSNQIRPCIYMRRMNTAVIRERYPIPIVEEILQDLNNSKIFSKLERKWAYHQIEFTLESKEITCFMVHEGLYR